ncbi:OmpP1/FadL family transporter [Riemerella columbipharyngis]|uniref:Long-chain fatty acid transport protein n=1 Tax=Riemerella columbipharyngis TaxID=1071918 RepID=A0A1G7CWL4_9FLAO|nr:outer membrane protein transport protein [Riemerella columbipharyngis]SDE43687.1 long-chain fatty acid transport protein [Riemerella columbipharyngis]
MKKFLIPATLICGLLAQAGGFRVSLQGVKQLAMAHTSAHAEDASVTFFNPAGMSFIPNKISVVAGGFATKTRIDYQNIETRESYSTNNPIGTPLYAAFAYKVADNVSVGFNFATPFGNTIKWPKGWTGEEMVEKLELKSFYFQPMVSFKLSDNVAIGGSYIYAKGSVDWDLASRKIGGGVNLKDNNASGQGFAIGFYFRPSEKIDVSVSYRSPVDMKAENGKVTMKASNIFYPLLGLDSNGQDNFKATLPLVDEYIIGATYKVTPKWQLSADFDYSGWERYNSLVLHFQNAKLGNQPNYPKEKVTPKNFKNTTTWRFGTQYMLTDNIAARLGYYYDESPYADKDFIPETPSFNSNVITGGLGFKLNNFGIDISGGYLFAKHRDFDNQYYNFKGQAKVNAFFLGLGLSYNAF